MNAMHFFILVSAVWRLSSLFANEKGPFHVFLRIREWAHHTCTTRQNGFLARMHFYDGLCCEWCNSMWFAGLIVVAYWKFGENAVWALIPFALSTWVIVIKYIVQGLENTVGDAEELS